jgi:hypothetical protein
MSTGAKVFQLIFVIVGLFFLGFGLLGVLEYGNQQASSATWYCKPDDATTTKCTGVGSTDADIQAALGYLLVGIGLEATAAAIAAGSRPPAPQPVPLPYPPMQPGGPVPAAPAGYPAPTQRPPWSS